jgi:hypothetical protein
MSTIQEIRAGIESDLAQLDSQIENDRSAIQAMLDTASAQRRNALTMAEDAKADALFKSIETARAARRRKEGALAQARAVEDDENRLEERLNVTHKTGAPRQNGTGKPAYDEVARIGSEPRVYSRDNDPEAKGIPFITDLISSFRGDANASERIARHGREYEVDNQGRKTRAAGDVTTGAFPNLVIPQYLVNEYAAKPSSARPFADICRHVDLPPEGMTVSLAKGNTTSTAALQATELVAPAGGNFDADPLNLTVQTAEAWQLVSRQAIERGKVTESLVLNDMLDQMHGLIDNTLITQTTTGLYDSGTRITYDSAAPLVTELYPFILQGASKISQALLNRGKPTHVLVHPRRWFWMQSLLSSQWPLFTQPGVPPQEFGTNTGNAYADGVAGRLPCGLDVVMDANVPTTALAGAQTGGTQDILFVVPQHECVLLEAPNREVFIRAEAPAASQLAVLLVVYEYFTYTFARYGATAFQRINGTGTVPVAGF